MDIAARITCGAAMDWRRWIVRFAIAVSLSVVLKWSTLYVGAVVERVERRNVHSAELKSMVIIGAARRKRGMWLTLQ